MSLTGSPSSLQILRKIGVPGTWKSSRKVHFRSRNCSAGTSASSSDMCLIIIHQNQDVSFWICCSLSRKLNRRPSSKSPSQDHAFPCSSFRNKLAPWFMLVLHYHAHNLHSHEHTCIITHISWYCHTSVLEHALSRTFLSRITMHSLAGTACVRLSESH